MAEPVIQWVSKRTTSKGDLYEVGFDDGVVALTMDAKLGELAQESKGQQAKRKISRPTPKPDSKFPASTWLNELEPIDNDWETTTAPTPLVPLGVSSSSIRLECLQIAANIGQEGDILILAQAFEDWVLGKKYATVQTTRVNEVQTDDIPF